MITCVNERHESDPVLAGHDGHRSVQVSGPTKRAVGWLGDRDLDRALDREHRGAGGGGRAMSKGKDPKPRSNQIVRRLANEARKGNRAARKALEKAADSDVAAAAEARKALRDIDDQEDER